MKKKSVFKSKWTYILAVILFLMVRSYEYSLNIYQQHSTSFIIGKLTSQIIISILFSALIIKIIKVIKNKAI